jgi:hypothetical protein
MRSRMRDILIRVSVLQCADSKLVIVVTDVTNSVLIAVYTDRNSYNRQLLLDIYMIYISAAHYEYCSVTTATVWLLLQHLQSVTKRKRHNCRQLHSAAAHLSCGEDA